MMKKIILALMLQLTVLMAIDFTIVPGSLIPASTLSVDGSEATTSETPLSTRTSTYLETVVIPTYDVNNPTHVLITPTNGKWNESVVNDLAYRHFYVTPGIYTNSALILRASGTENVRRTISLYNPLKPTDDTHPAALPTNEQASVKLIFSGAEYWTIDRLSAINNSPDYYTLQMLENSQYNILNRLNLTGFYKGIVIRPGSHYNTIQNSYIHDSLSSGLKADNVGIFLNGGDGGPGIATYGTKILNNDIKNINDGVQLQRKHGETINADFAGTIIDSNRVWIDGDVYTNGNGVQDPNGRYAMAENAIDLKDGSNDPNNPVIISNNIAWGYKQADPVTSGNAPGVPINIAFTNTKNVVYDSNIVFDSQWGMHLMLLRGTGSKIINNIMYHIGHDNPPTPQYPDGKDVFAFTTPQTAGILAENNTMKDIAINPIKGGWTIYQFDNDGGVNIKNNLFIDSQQIGGNLSDQNRDNTWYYNHTGSKLGGTNEHDIGTADPRMGNYIVEYDRFTTNPKRKTLNGVVVTTDSPHYEKAGSTITAVETGK